MFAGLLARKLFLGLILAGAVAGVLATAPARESTAATAITPGLWAAIEQSNVGLSMRVEPGRDPEADDWRFFLGVGTFTSTEVECPPEPSSNSWSFTNCGVSSNVYQAFQAVVARDSLEIKVTLRSGNTPRSATMRRVPDRTGPASSANVSKVWQRNPGSDCRTHLGVWAQDGVAFAPCVTGIVELLDAASGRLVGKTSLQGSSGGSNTVAQEVAVRDGFLYVATTNRGVLIYDVEDPQNPTFEGQIINEAGATSPQSVTNVHTLTISPDGRRLFVANYSYAASRDLRVFDISNPRSPTPLGTPYFDTARDTTTHDVSMEDRDGKLLAYVSLLGGGLVILDATDANQMRAIGRPTPWPGIFSHASAPFGIDGRYYLAHTDEGYNQGLTVIDVTDPSRPEVVSRFKSREGISIHNIRVIDGIAYISYYLDGLRIVDLRDPANPTEIGHYDTVPSERERTIFGGAWGVHVDGGLVFISDTSTGTYAFRFTP